MKDIKKCDLFWSFDGEKVVMGHYGRLRTDSCAVLVTKHRDQKSTIAGTFADSVLNGEFLVGYDDSCKHGWDLRLKLSDIEFRVNASRPLPPDAPEVLFFNTSSVGTELFALIPGNGMGDIHRFRFPAKCGFQWMAVLQFYLAHFGLDFKTIATGNNGKEVSEHEENA